MNLESSNESRVLNIVRENEIKKRERRIHRRLSKVDMLVPPLSFN